MHLLRIGNVAADVSAYLHDDMLNAAVSNMLELYWSDRMQALWRHSGFSEEMLRPAAITMGQLHRKAPTSTLLSVYKKYGQPRFNSVSKLTGLHDRLQERINTI